MKKSTTGIKKLLPALAVLSATALLTAGLAGCGRQAGVQKKPDDAAGTYRTITPEAYKKMLDDGNAVILVDVRTPEEYAAERLEGAVNIPVETIGDTGPEQLPDRDAVIVLYCRSGNRTVTAAEKLLKLGYKNVYDMGGIIDWPYETVKDSAAAATAADGILSRFSARDLDGNTVDAGIFADYKLTMVNIWATFCTPCIGEMPELGSLHREYAGKGVQIVGIVADAADSSGGILPDMVETAGQIVELTGADYLHLLPSADLNDALLEDVAAVPTTIFVDAAGNQVGEVYVGAKSSGEWRAIIDQLLEEAGE
jgi:rhodanese-related sulfurtransferase